MMRLALQITARTLFDTEVTPEIHDINDQVNIVMDLYNFLVALAAGGASAGSPLPQMRRFRAARNAWIGCGRHDSGATRGSGQRRRKLESRADLLSMLLAARDDQVEGMG